MRAVFLFLLLLMALGVPEQSFVYPVPPPNEVSVQTGIPYMMVKESSLALDFYRPANAAPKDRFPILVFVNGFGGTWLRDSPQYQAWARAATAHGLAAVNADSNAGSVGENFDGVVAYLTKHAVELQVDPERIAVMATSGNVDEGLPLVENPQRKTIKAAVFYYGAAEVTQYRLDLPVLFVRAGLDRPAANQAFDEMVAAGLTANAPWTVLNYPSGHHGFDILDDNDLSRQTIEQTFRFMQAVVSESYQAVLHAGLTEATAAAALARGDYAQAIALYGALASTHPQDFRILLSYGEALLGGKQYRAARIQFDRVKVIGGAGPRDLGVPAAEACALDNDPDAAIAWLKTIPSRFIPNSLQLDPAFTPLRKRADFQALFRP